MMTEDRWLLEPASPPVPVVACLPHGGHHYPAELTGPLRVDPEILWSDWLTRELYDFLPSLGVTTITTAYSRFVADVNRDPNGEQHGGFWTSVVSAQLPDGQPVYSRRLTRPEIAHRIRLAHRPFHRALDSAIERLLPRFPRLLVLDLHSFGVPLDGDVILGNRLGATARPAVMQLLADAFTSCGFAVRLNERFTGGWTVRRFARQERVDAVQIELNQRCYLDMINHSPPRPPLPGAFGRTKEQLRTALADRIIASLPRWP